MYRRISRSSGYLNWICWTRLPRYYFSRKEGVANRGWKHRERKDKSGGRKRLARLDAIESMARFGEKLELGSIGQVGRRFRCAGGQEDIAGSALNWTAVSYVPSSKIPSLRFETRLYRVVAVNGQVWAHHSRDIRISIKSRSDTSRLSRWLIIFLPLEEKRKEIFNLKIYLVRWWSFLREGWKFVTLFKGKEVCCNKYYGIEITKLVESNNISIAWEILINAFRSG